MTIFSAQKPGNTSVFIHPTAIVDSKAVLGAGTSVGPYCCIGPDVVLGKQVTLHSHVVVTGLTYLGDDTQCFPFASVGHCPQDKKYVGERSKLFIGKRNIIREYVTLQPGTKGGGMQTRVGDDCLLMASAHVAHDCTVGNRVVMANNATLGGHVCLEDDVVMGGFSALHQFVRVGRGAFISGTAAASRDIIPYGFLGHGLNKLVGLNLVGLKRQNTPPSEISDALSVVRHLLITHKQSMPQRIADISDQKKNSVLVKDILQFIAASKRPLCLLSEQEKS